MTTDKIDQPDGSRHVFTADDERQYRCKQCGKERIASVHYMEASSREFYNLNVEPITPGQRDRPPSGWYAETNVSVINSGAMGHRYHIRPDQHQKPLSGTDCREIAAFFNQLAEVIDHE